MSTQAPPCKAADSPRLSLERLLAQSSFAPTRLVAGLLPRPSLPPSLPLTPAQPPRDSRPKIPAFPLSSPSSTRQAPDAADRLGLALNVCEEVPVAIALQPLLDEGPEDDLEAHREL